MKLELLIIQSLSYKLNQPGAGVSSASVIEVKEVGISELLKQLKQIFNLHKLAGKSP